MVSYRFGSGTRVPFSVQPARNNSSVHNGFFFVDSLRASEASSLTEPLTPFPVGAANLSVPDVLDLEQKRSQYAHTQQVKSTLFRHSVKFEP